MGFGSRIDVDVVIVMILMAGLIGMCINGEMEEDEVVGGAGAPMTKTEQEALYTAIQGFVGKWWNGSDLYPDPCGWTPIQGVSCDLFDEFWYVTNLNIGPIHDNSFACAPNLEFRPHLFQLKHLKSLSFVDCFVTPRHGPVSIPSGNWAGLSTSLESLEFRSNPGLTGQIPDDFGQLQKLQSLVLIENGLSGGLPHNIGNLTRLKRLVVSGNGFSGEIGDNYGYLSELLILDLSRNSFSGNIPLTFGGLTSLLKLDLSRNQLEGKIPNEISKLKNLTLLDLSDNKISGGLTKSIQEMSSLKVLVLSRNPIGGDIMNIKWQNLEELTILDLSNTGSTGGIPESVSKMKDLRFLGLNNNNLSGNISPELGELPNLTSLYVYGNNFTGELGFSQGYFGKMGRRFGAWDNPNLCFRVGLMHTGFGPFGVKACREKVMLDEVRLRDAGFVTSFGFLRYEVDWIWCVFTVVIVFSLFM